MNSHVSDEFSEFRSHTIVTSVEEVLSKLPFKETDTLLDVCCGSGDLTKRLVQKTGLKSATAFDINPSMVECAKRTNASQNINYIVGDAGDCKTYINLKNSFDKALAYYALHWVKNWPDTIRFIYDSLKDGGKCYLNILVDTDGDIFHVVDDSVRELHKYKEYMKDYVYRLYPLRGKGEDFVNILQDSGFIDIKWEVDKVRREYTFENDTIGKGAIKTMLSYLEKIPEHLKDAFLDDVYQLFLTKCEKTIDGKAKWHGTLLTAVATKPSYNQ